MRVLVCGSRDWARRASIERRLERLPRDATIIHGAASRKQYGVERSADMLADAVARDLGFAVERFPADWRSEPRRAGILRNLEMLDTLGASDLVLAFQRNGSRGTQHTIDEARRRGIPVKVFTA